MMFWQNKGEIMKNIKYIIIGLSVMVLATGCVNKTPKVQDTVAQINEEKEQEDSSKQESEKKENTKEEEEKTQTDSNENQQNDDTQNDTPEEVNNTTDTNEASVDTSGQTDVEKSVDVNDDVKPQPTQVEQISLDGLSTETKGWGPGGNVDENNVPVGCTMYQKKYGDLSADFVRTDSESVFLTFDEGYEYPEANSPTGNTSKILDTLKEKNVKAVFFVTLPYLKSNPDLVKRMIDEGHVVGNHSVTHPSNGLPSLATVEDQQNEVLGVHDYMLENYNYTMNLFRYPTGAFSEQSLAILHNLGYRSVFWSFAYKDWITDAQPDETEALNHMVEKLHPGAIYLLHAVSTTNVDVLGDFIDSIKAAGYEIERYE